MCEITFDEQDTRLLAEKLERRAALQGPLNGDFVRFPTGEIERISNTSLEKGVQTSPVWAGSYFLTYEGDASFSGSLHPVIPRESLTLVSGDTQLGSFWFFHHDRAGAGRGVYCSAFCNVYQTNAPYKGYLTRAF